MKPANLVKYSGGCDESQDEQRNYFIIDRVNCKVDFFDFNDFSFCSLNVYFRVYFYSILKVLL